MSLESERPSRHPEASDNDDRLDIERHDVEDAYVSDVLGEEQARELIERYEGEGQPRRLTGGWAWVASAIAIGLSLYALYVTQATIQAQIYRTTFLGAALVLTFLLYPASRRWGTRLSVLDLLLALAGLATALYPLWEYDSFVRRAVRPTELDVVMGTVLIVLILEATRRTVGWILPALSISLLAYGRWGYLLPGEYGHKGYELDRMVGSLYITLEGIFGVPLDVAATYIILFTIYGAVLEYSGAGKFFLDFSLAATGRRVSGAGRTTTIAGFMLGTVSGSGVATTVTLGSVAWPMLRRAGYSPESGGAVLSAGGIGAILSPPTLGAAAFLIAEILQISYLEVLKMATIPTILYYLSIFLMIELDSRKLGNRDERIAGPSAMNLTKRYGYHFTSLIAIVALMMLGFTPISAVFWATGLAFVLSFVRRETALTPRRSLRALESGAIGTLSVAATTATAGIIVGIFTLTGLGLKMADLIVELANGQLFFTVVLTALAVWILGLAVPVTASYIIAAAITAPALIQMGVPDVAAHMFIFYYAVLSEVSPPTALSPFAAAAITGGNPFKTMMLTWKYTLPAFIVPFMFTLNRDQGINLLARGELSDIILSTTTACLAIAAMVAGVGGWLLRPVNLLERALLIPAAGFLLYTGPFQDVIGLTLLVTAVVIHALRTRIPGRLAPR
ncbi:MAG TPA: TRAP transporter fused permease subunit [Thermomicrobiales bacterium]|nr:TRAP transporter fused permease subunit [Thermomicrobiales bacterium]